MMNTLEQFSEIEASLRKAKSEIEEQTAIIKAMACTPETIKDCKKARADMNKQLEQWETARKQLKKKVLEPYEKFEQVYKECITSQYRIADGVIKERINETETYLKDQKSKEIETYFEEYRAYKGLEFVSYRDLNVKITLSESKKSLKELVAKKLDHIAEDVKVIREQNYAEEILVEYSRCFDIALAMQIVSDRKKKIEEISKPKEDTGYVYEPDIEEEYTLSFKVTASKTKLKKLKEFLDKGDYTYE